MMLFRTFSARQGGFALSEIIIVVAVLAVLVTLISVPFITLFDIQLEKRELEIQKRIERGLRDYARANNYQLPPEANWEDILGPSIGLSSEELLMDMWDNPRYYRVFTSTETFRETDLTFSYAVVYSHGRDGALTLGTDAEVGDGVGNDLSDLFDGADASENKNIFRDFTPGVTPNGDDTLDDLFIKYTTYDELTEVYYETVRRMDAIADALGTYGRLYKNLALSDGTGGIDPEDLAYFPPSRPMPTAADVPIASYFQPMRDDVNNRVGSESVDDVNDPVDADRMVGMGDLLRVLGLPDSYCCNAIDGRAFYYYSFPRPPIDPDDGACGGATYPLGGSVGEPIQPPVISIDPYNCG